MRPRILWFVLVAAVLAVPPVAGQPAPSSPAAPEAVGPKLPPKLRSLLLREMYALLAAASRLQEGLVRGQSSVVAEQAAQMRDSFVLKKEMSDEQRAALRAAVGPAFVERDRAFHQLAGRLATAAEAGDRALQHQLHGELIGACASCHARHAPDRFPGFAEAPQAAGKADE